MITPAQKKWGLKTPASAKSGTVTQKCNGYKLWVSLDPYKKSDAAFYTIKEQKEPWANRGKV